MDRKAGNYLDWNHEDILEWILSLDNGIFVQYQSELTRVLKEENVSGDDLSIVDMDDLKRWGVKQFKHLKLLSKRIKELTNIQGVNKWVDANKSDGPEENVTFL